MSTPSRAVRAIHADAVITGDRDALRDAAIVVEGDAIVDVGAAADVLPLHAGVAVERVRGVVLPALVNAHAHVELSALRGHVAGGAGFVPWVEKLIGMRVQARPEEDDAAIEQAVAELEAYGTAAVGEVTNSLAAVRALARRGIGGCIFHEVVGVRADEARARLERFPHTLEERVGAWPTTDLAYAPAPHTLYTLAIDVAREVIARAKNDGVRTTLHLAEHPAERRALEAGEGPVADWYERFLNMKRTDIVWPHKSPVDLAADVGALAPHVLLVHLTDARAEELAKVAASGAPVVLCPRSNLHIETKLPPLLAARAAGIEPALGTDSLASNASLDVLAEARALADRFHGVPARDLVQMATWNGARALGRTELGRIAKGARPGLVGIDGDVEGDACAFVLRTVRAPRRWIVRRVTEHT
jgi:cytosine/adenosine deaminase-related metal-dependent hydrolase